MYGGGAYRSKVESYLVEISEDVAVHDFSTKKNIIIKCVSIRIRPGSGRDLVGSWFGAALARKWMGFEC